MPVVVLPLLDVGPLLAHCITVGAPLRDWACCACFDEPQSFNGHLSAFFK